MVFVTVWTQSGDSSCQPCNQRNIESIVSSALLPSQSFPMLAAAGTGMGFYGAGISIGRRREVCIGSAIGLIAPAPEGPPVRRTSA